MKQKQLLAIKNAISIYNHEINNPLTILYGTIQTMEPKDEAQKKLIEQMEKNAERILNASAELNEIDQEYLTGILPTGELSLENIPKKS